MGGGGGGEERLVLLGDLLIIIGLSLPRLVSGEVGAAGLPAGQ